MTMSWPRQRRTTTRSVAAAGSGSITSCILATSTSMASRCRSPSRTFTPSGELRLGGGHDDLPCAGQQGINLGCRCLTDSSAEWKSTVIIMSPGPWQGGKSCFECTTLKAISSCDKLLTTSGWESKTKKAHKAAGIACEQHDSKSEKVYSAIANA